MKQAKLLNKDEFKRLNAVIDSKRHAARNHVIVSLSFYAGLRACEIASLRVGDVFTASGDVRDTAFLEAAQTKGSERHAVLLSKRLQVQLRRYAAHYPNLLNQPHKPLVFSSKGGGFSAQTMINLFAKLFVETGIKGASSHSGRRQFITELADKGINARVVQALARHKHLSTTQRYIDLNEGKLRAAIELS